MIKYKYIPFTYGKAQYKGKSDSGKTVGSWITRVSYVACSQCVRKYVCCMLNVSEN